MYIEALHLKDFRNFVEEELSLLHPDKEGGDGEWPNINLLLGPNGSGKTTILRALGIGLLADFMPRFLSRFLIRAEPGNGSLEEALIRVTLKLHREDGQGKPVVTRSAHVHRQRGIFPGDNDDGNFEAIFEEHSPGFFMVGFGASRWTPVASQYDIPEARNQKNHPRYQRIASLFEDNFGLMPFEAWLRSEMFERPHRFAKVVDLINLLLPPEIKMVNLLGSVAGDEKHILFEDEKGIRLPLNALSDSYRSYLAWMGDMVYHLASCCPDDRAFNDFPGVVLVDEIDLHLHPKWQQEVLSKICKGLPRIQFVVTSHSPLVASTLPARNIFLMSTRNGCPKVIQLDQEIQGLDADQTLLTPYFGLETTQTPGFHHEVDELYQKAMDGDDDAALAIMDLYAGGVKDDRERS